jgi:hypothetical protein
MNSRIPISVSSIVMVLLPAMTLLAQTRPHDEIMRDVASSFGALRENLEAEAFSDFAEDAARLESLFAEVEDFWAVFETQDAIELAISAQQGAHDVASAAADNDAESARAGFAMIQRTCESCHTAHREEMPDGSFRIKP